MSYLLVVSARNFTIGWIVAGTGAGAVAPAVDLGVKGGISVVRATSNPVFRNLPQNSGGYAPFGTATPNTRGYQQPYPSYPATTRAITIDDVVVKTAITFAVLTGSAVVSFLLVARDHALAGPLAGIGALVGLVLVLVATFGRKMANPGIVLSYAVAEGVFLGALSFLFADVTFKGVGGGGLIGEALLGTFGVFAGMLVAYKTGAIRVTPRTTKMVIGATFGLLVLMVGNLVAGLVTHGAGPLRDGGAVAILFSLVCIGVAAFNLLLDFDMADKLIRAHAPERMAWAVALGLTVTLVWLYVEILRLLGYFNNR